MSDCPLVGSWRLVRWENRRDDGSVHHVEANGLLIYAADGYMLGTLALGTRHAFAAADLVGGTLEEAAAAARSFIAYGGSYTFHQDRVRHQVQVSLFPNWVGGVQERFVGFVGEHLVLTTPPTAFRGSTIIGRLEWERTSA